MSTPTEIGRERSKAMALEPRRASCRNRETRCHMLVGLALGLFLTHADEGRATRLPHLPATSWSIAIDRDKAVEEGREAIVDTANYPWYDEETDGLKAVPVEPLGKLRQSNDWEWDASSRRRNRGNWNSAFWESFWRIFQYLIWTALAIGLLVAIYMWLRAAAEREWARAEGGSEAERDERHQADLIEQLPFQVKRPTTDLLAEARRNYERGDFREAIIYLFSYQLVQLDRSGKLRLSKGKTNRQYLNELRRTPRLSELLVPTMLAFEDVFFGNYDLQRARFESCWQHIDEFERLLGNVSGAE